MRLMKGFPGVTAGLTSPALKRGFKNFDMNWGLTNDFPAM